MIAIALRADDDGVATVPIRRIVLVSNAHRRSVEKAIARLLTKGELSVIEPGGSWPGGVRRANTYRLMPGGWPVGAKLTSRG